MQMSNYCICEAHADWENKAFTDYEGNEPSFSATNILQFNDVWHHVYKKRPLFRPDYPALLMDKRDFMLVSTAFCCYFCLLKSQDK